MLKNNAYPNHQSLKTQLEREYGGTYKFTRQTLYRDIDYLKSLGAIIEFDHKNHNGYYLENTNWTGYASFLTEDEMAAAMLGAQFAEQILPPSPLREKIRSSVDNLWAKTSLSNEDAEANWNSLVIQGLPLKIDPQVFQTVFEQWRSQHNVEITYTSASEGKTKIHTIEPQVLTFYNNTWYVRGKVVSQETQSPEPQQFRNFALHRISAAKRNGKLFEPDFKEINAVNQGRTFDLPRLTGVRLKARGRALRVALESLPVGKEENRTEDSAILTIQEIEEYKIIKLVMTSAGDLEILEPETLKVKARQQAEAVVKALS
jgi:predicted DNA-binding transcriptional regulator YafY